MADCSRIFTARKRCLQELCFHRCLSVHREGISVQGVGSLSRRSLFMEGIHPGKGGLCPREGVHCPGKEGLCPWGYVQGGLCPVVSVQGGLCPEGLCRGDPPRQRFSPHGNVWAVRILLECILVSIISGFVTFLRQVYLVPMPLNPYWNCKVVNPLGYTTSLCSTLLILSMTFDRFYSIIRPHKAASFNTAKRAKISIVCIVIFSALYNFLQFFVTVDDGVRCTNALLPYVEIYYWLSFAVNFLLPFVFLLTMNVVIIHTLRQRANMKLIDFNNQAKGQNGDKNSKMKSSETQIYVTLLMVTFGFLILTTPPYVLSLFIPVANFSETPKRFAGFHLSFQVAQKTFFTNNCIFLCHVWTEILGILGIVRDFRDI